MSESSSRVQLVRCPKCGHLLPELPPYSVYCCGGCGALSRAEKKSSVDDGLSEKSWEDRIVEGSERESNFGIDVGFDRGRANDRPSPINRVSKSPVRSRYGEAIRKSPIRESNSGDLDSGRRSAMRRSALGDFDAQSKSSGRSMDGDVRKASSVRSVRGGVRKSVSGDFDERRSVERDVPDSEEWEAREKVGAWFDNVKEDVEYVKEEVEFANRFVTQKGSLDQWLDYEASADESELSGPRVQPRRTWRSEKSPMGFGLNPMREQVGRGTGQVVDETESDYDDMYGRRRVVHDDWVRGGDNRLPRGQRDLIDQDEFGGVYGSNRVSSLPQRFAVHPNVYGYDQPRYPHARVGGSSSLQNVEMNRAELIRQYNEVKKKLSMTGDLLENTTIRGHPSLSSADFYGGLDDYVQDDLIRSGRSVESIGARMRLHEMSYHQVPGPFDNDRYLDDLNSFPPTRLSANELPQHRPHYYPQRSAHDYIPRHSMDAIYDPAGLNPQRENLHNPMNLRTHVQAPPAFGYRRYQNSRNDDFPDSYGQHTSGPRLSSHSQRSHDSKSDGGGPAQAVTVKKNHLLCHPISGAAPLVICYSCSELLRLPKKLIATNKTQCRLQCGSCRTTLSFDFGKKKSHASMQQPKPNLTNVHDVPSKISESDHKSTLAGSPAGITNCESYDFDKTGYTFPSTDSEPSMKLDAAKRLGQYTSTNDVPKEDLHLDNAINSMPPPLQEHVDYSDGITAKPDENETNASGHDLDARTELELNSDEIPIGDVSLSSAEASNKHDGGDKKEKSSSGIIGRGFQDLSPPINSSNAKTDVFVNGQPLPHRVVRKAEKLAGPVSPGNYWYDSRAGFWGVMGNHCLGIIPPFILEFGFPMPVDCSSGDTGICVNGRELHAKDLDLLAGRGLPRTRNKWYVIDISGKVQDEETGDAVVNLGKLAPSVEKAKHGFGMHSPEI